MEYECKTYIFQSKSRNIFDNENLNLKKENNRNKNNKNKIFFLYSKFVILLLFLFIIKDFLNNTKKIIRFKEIFLKNLSKSSSNKTNNNIIYNNLSNIIDKDTLIIPVYENDKFNVSNNNQESNFDIINNINNLSIIINKKLYWKNETMDINTIHNEIKKYSIINSSIFFDEKDNYYERKNPKISIIITLYNQINFIYKIYFSILNQSLKDIEIIFVDDASTDNCSYIINELMKNDKRIIYIKNLINKGQFYSRNKGVLNSRGEYVLIIDPDDLLLNNILLKAYETAKIYNLEVVQYYHMIGRYENNTLFPMNITGILYPPQIKNIFFNTSDRYLWDKLIKRETFIRAIYFMKEKYRNQRFAIHNDELVCFGICKVANSYGVLEQIGYFYNRFNPNSTTKNIYKLKYINIRLRSMFTIMRYYYDHTEDNIFEKMTGYNFFMLRIAPRNERVIKYLTQGLDYIIEVLDIYLNSQYFNQEQKNNLTRFKDKVNDRKSKLNKLKIIKIANSTNTII